MPPVRSDAIANRERILAAARAVFAETGIHAEVKDIADRAGLGVGTIYRNFPGKHDLLKELCRSMAGEMAAALSEGEDNDDPLAGLRVGLTGGYDIARRYGWLLHAKLNQQLPREIQETLKPPSQDARYQAVKRMIVRAQAAGQIRADIDPALVLVLMFNTIWPLLTLPQLAGMPGSEIADMVIDLVLHGVATQSSNPVCAVPASQVA